MVRDPPARSLLGVGHPGRHGDTLLAELGGDLEDDVALLAVRTRPEDRPRPPEAGPPVEPAELQGR